MSHCPGPVPDKKTAIGYSEALILLAFGVLPFLSEPLDKQNNIYLLSLFLYIAFPIYGYRDKKDNGHKTPGSLENREVFMSGELKSMVAGTDKSWGENDRTETRKSGESIWRDVSETRIART